MRRIILFVISFYHIFISPILKQLFGISCRYQFTCSEYAKKMFATYPFFEASKKTLVRLLHCQPLATRYEYL